MLFGLFSCTVLHACKICRLGRRKNVGRTCTVYKFHAKLLKRLSDRRRCRKKHIKKATGFTPAA